MNTCHIQLPKIFRAENAQNVIYALHRDYCNSFAPNVDQVVFDFSLCEDISPVGLIYINMWKDELISQGRRTFYRKSNPKTDSFLKRMRLLPKLGESEDNQIEDRYFYDIHCCKNAGECSNAHKDIIADVVQRDRIHDETYCAIDYMINEMWDNAGVHGYECYNKLDYPKPVYICALEKDDYYEVCIGDRGQGIYQSLHKHNANVQLKNKKDTIKAAINTAANNLFILILLRICLLLKDNIIRNLNFIPFSGQKILADTKRRV